MHQTACQLFYLSAGAPNMCGINGIYAYHYASNPIDRAEALRTRDHMQARGPDGSGLWVSTNERIAFGHRRLSIIDLSEAGAQPMVSADGRFVVSFNGEIYNYRELRRRLEARGYVFRSNSDTEVLLHLYADKGGAMVHELRGMFAFAIWDEQRQEIFLARDPYGIKPLYYADDGWTFRFASQVKALLAGGAVSREAEPAGAVGFYLFGSIPEPFTSFRAIRAVPAGAIIKVDRMGAHAPQRYHSIAQIYVDSENAACGRKTPTQHEAQELLRHALLDSVRHHLVADVPVGAFLSAGIDSGALVGLMRDVSQQDIQTVTLTFEEFQGRSDDEVPLAKTVARQYGTRHTTRVVTRNEFDADLPKLLASMDQPSIDGINAWFVSKAAKELGLKVAVSGLGGDEMFGGYPSFRDLPRWVAWLRPLAALPLLGRTARRLSVPVISRLNHSPKAAGILEFGGRWEGAWLLKRGLYMPWELEEVLDLDAVREGLRRLSPLRLIAKELDPRPRTDFGCVAALEASLYMRNQLLRDTDWASMAHALEVRVPLVDTVLLERVASFAGPLLAAKGKTLLAQAPSQPLPSAVTNRRKTGFTTPVAVWMQDQAESQRGAGVAPWARRWGHTIHSRAARSALNSALA